MKETYEAPTMLVVDVNVEYCILQTSNQEVTGGTIPGFGDMVNI